MKNVIIFHYLHTTHFSYLIEHSGEKEEEEVARGRSFPESEKQKKSPEEGREAVVEVVRG